MDNYWRYVLAALFGSAVALAAIYGEWPGYALAGAGLAALYCWTQAWNADDTRWLEQAREDEDGEGKGE